MNWMRGAMIVMTLLALQACVAQAREFSVPVLSAPGALQTVNRSASAADGAILLDAAESDGIAWLNDVDFRNGRVSVDVRGADNPGRSFVGLAFPGADDENYDVVYLRPFNFNAPDPVRRARALQYMSLPAYPWQNLREQSPGRYEAALTPAPAADAWVRLELEVRGNRLRVFIDGASTAALETDLLSDRAGGRIGFWVGNNSDGAFRNLRIEHEPGPE